MFKILEDKLEKKRETLARVNEKYDIQRMKLMRTIGKLERNQRKRKAEIKRLEELNQCESIEIDTHRRELENMTMNERVKRLETEINNIIAEILTNRNAFYD